jgi:extracellular factor (EF) 3-hydroxypalmitic acid methyl ester biosynthesis protein
MSVKGASPVPNAQNAPEPTLDGHLVREGRSYPVTVARSGRTALRVAFADGEPPDRTEFESLVVTVGGCEERLSACRFEAGRCDRFAGSLVFLDDVYDTRALVFDGTVVTPRGALASLPLVLSNKDAVRPQFRAYVADAMYDLSVWRKFFDDEERVLEGEKPDAAEAVRGALLKTYGPEFFAAFERQLAELNRQVEGFTAQEHERHGFYLRRHAWPYILASEFMRRSNLKPYGYAGDAEMMRIIYENRYVGATAFERLMHKYALEIPAARAVRNRRELVAGALRTLAEQWGALKGGLRVLSVAAGPAWELQDVILDARDAERFRFTLLDQDTYALGAAREVVARLERARGVPLRVAFVQESVRTMVRARLADRVGRFHCIYSMGLFDYLAMPVARAVLARLHDLLEPGGVLLVGNFHAANPSRVYMEYWGDWKLLYRTEASMLAMAQDLPGASASVGFDDTRCQMLLRVETRR